MGFGSVGVKEFIKLDDTPASYAGQSGKLAAVKAAENALEFIAAPPTMLFGGRWQQASSSGHGPAIWQAGYDYVSQVVHGVGEDHQLYTLPQLNWGLWNDESLAFKLGKVTPQGGTPQIFIGITQDEPNIMDNLNTRGIWFHIFNQHVYAENADGVARTWTYMRDSDFGVPTWLSWTRWGDTIKFYYRGELKATHTTNLPDPNKNCIFTFQMRGVDATGREFAITRPRIKNYQP